MIKGASQLLEYFDQINSVNGDRFIFFSIHRKGQIEKGYPLIETPSGDNSWDIQKARDYLSKWLSLQTWGEFTISLNEKEGTTRRGALRQDFSIDSAGSVAGIGSPGPSMSEGDIAARIADGIKKAIEEQAREARLKSLEDELSETKKLNKDLDRKANDPWTRLISGIEPYVPHILGEMGIIKQSAIGNPNQPVTKATLAADQSEPGQEMTTEQEAELQQRLEAVVQKFMKARPGDWLSLLETLGSAIEKNPALGDKIGLINML